MSPKLQPVRGTHDILPQVCGGEFDRFYALVTLARELAISYGFLEIATPIFESTEVFSRSMGETSDVVSKEMFTFQTKGDESVTLRPEFTAGIVRAFLSNGMQQHLPLKLFSTGPLFRYERPQKGRQRQFHQVNFEWLGDNSWQADVEIIMLAGQLLYYLSGRGCKLLINTLGDQESRVRYREALVHYLTPYVKSLSEDSQRRLVTNPLRILDSKSEQDKEITENAPKITDHLSDRAKQRFDNVCNALIQDPLTRFLRLEIAPSLVRGLDYYTDTVFEFVAEAGELGAQNTVLAGGRYDKLVEQMGGKSTPAIGFAAGIERLLLLMQGPQSSWQEISNINIMIFPLEDVSSKDVFAVAAALHNRLFTLLRKMHLKRKSAIEIGWEGSLSKRLGRAAQRGATYAVILGKEEVGRGVCLIKNMKTNTQSEALIADLSDEQKLIQIFNITELDSRLRGNDEGQK